MRGLLKWSAGLAAAMMVLAALFPWQNPTPQVEALFGLGCLGVCVSGAVLLARWWHDRRLRRLH